MYDAPRGDISTTALVSRRRMLPTSSRPSPAPRHIAGPLEAFLARRVFAVSALRRVAASLFAVHLKLHVLAYRVAARLVSVGLREKPGDEHRRFLARQELARPFLEFVGFKRVLDDVVFKADARLPFYLRRVRGRYPFERQLRMRLVQHEFELTRLARGEQYQVAALVARAARASAAVDEGFEVLRQSVLYDVADGVYVEAADRTV